MSPNHTNQLLPTASNSVTALPNSQLWAFPCFSMGKTRISGFLSHLPEPLPLGAAGAGRQPPAIRALPSPIWDLHSCTSRGFFFNSKTLFTDFSTHTCVHSFAFSCPILPSCHHFLRQYSLREKRESPHPIFLHKQPQKCFGVFGL